MIRRVCCPCGRAVRRASILYVCVLSLVVRGPWSVLRAPWSVGGPSFQGAACRFSIVTSEVCPHGGRQETTEDYGHGRRDATIRDGIRARGRSTIRASGKSHYICRFSDRHVPGGPSTTRSWRTCAEDGTRETKTDGTEVTEGGAGPGRRCHRVLERPYFTYSTSRRPGASTRTAQAGVAQADTYSRAKRALSPPGRHMKRRVLGDRLCRLLS
ncbi:hypothetical protein BV20DRAFT_419085 [Pilatotrama ljubarskyi]|nr:hypothetical protein BV20DRAFT_419085 [Pilatotrama ljubarskyi]